MPSEYDLQKGRIYNICKRIDEMRRNVEWEILREQTGDRRNHLTDANIQLMGALESLEKAMRPQ